MGVLGGGVGGGVTLTLAEEVATTQIILTMFRSQGAKTSMRTQCAV